MALHGVDLSPDELHQIEYTAKAKRAALLNLPKPKLPGFWDKVRRFGVWLLSLYLDRRALTKAVSEQAARICELEDLLEENKIRIPGGRSDE